MELALYAIGRDRPGIVAALAKVLLDHEVNIEDAQATILRGHFAIVLILEAPDDAEADVLLDDLTEAAEELELEWIHVGDVAEAGEPASDPSHILSVYGGDHPGIVHAVSSALAERDIGITDLNSRMVDGDNGDEPIYVLMLEITLPAGIREDEVRSALDEVAESEGVEVLLNELERDDS